MSKIIKLLTYLITATVLTTSLPAQAGFFDALGDVLSFGQVGRERDRTRAEMNRTLALERQLAAEREKHQKIKSLLEKNAIVSSNLAADKEVKKALVLLQSLIESQKNFMAKALELLLMSNAELSGISELVAIQQNDLREFLKAYQAGDPANQGVAKVLEKLEYLTQQVEDFPTSDWDQLAVDNLIVQAFENTEEVETVLASTVEMVSKKIADQEAAIKRNKEEQKKLQQKPKVRGYITRCPRMDRKMRCLLEP